MITAVRVRHLHGRIRGHASSGKVLLKVTDDVVGFVHPLHITVCIRDAQARDLDLATAFNQLLTAGGMMQCIAGLDVEREALDGASCLDAERAGEELVHDQTVRLRVDALLLCRRALDALRAGQPVQPQQDGADDGVDGLEKISEEKSHGFDPGRVTASALYRGVVADNDKTVGRGRQQVFGLALPGRSMQGFVGIAVRYA